MNDKKGEFYYLSLVSLEYKYSLSINIKKCNHDKKAILNVFFLQSQTCETTLMHFRLLAACLRKSLFKQSQSAYESECDRGFVKILRFERIFDEKSELRVLK